MKISTSMTAQKALGGHGGTIHVCLFPPRDYLALTDIISDPGCAVDIPAICYSLSFAPNPNFSKLFPSQPEILDYINDVAAQYGVHSHFTGSTEWRGAQWRESTKSWTVTFEDLPTGQIFTQRCKILISGVGGLVNPNDFDVPGAQTFKGDIVHTARWNPNLDLTGKHVVVVGNGCEYDP